MDHEYISVGFEVAGRQLFLRFRKDTMPDSAAKDCDRMRGYLERLVEDAEGKVVEALRDKLAGLAMAGLCLQATGQYDKGPCNSAIAERAYVLADAMLKARKV